MIERQIPRKNYIIYTVFVIIILSISFGLFIIRENYKYYVDGISVLERRTTEIKIEELDDYIDSNKDEDILILFSNPRDRFNCKDLEKDLSKRIKKRKIKVLYVRVDSLEIDSDFKKSFNEKYASEKTLEKYPAFVYIKNKQIIDIEQRMYTKLYADDIFRMIDKYGLRGDKND